MTSLLTGLAKDPVVNQLKTFITEIDNSISAIQGTKEPKQELITKYEELKVQIQGTINESTTMELKPLTDKLNGYQSSLFDLHKERASFMLNAQPNAYTFSDFVSITAGKTLDITLFLLFCLAVLFGGIFASQYVIDKSLAYRIYYFVYGAAFFPFTLLYTTFYPTYWRSWIFPLVEKGSESSILSTPPLSYLWSFISFSRPTPRDGDPEGGIRTTKFLMSFFSAGSLIAFVIAYFLKYQKLPISSLT